MGRIPALLVKERFQNSEALKETECPTLLIHGMQDSLIPYTHSQVLHTQTKGPSKLILPNKMTHNEFDLEKDIMVPIKHFLIESFIHSFLPKSSKAIIIKDKYF